MKMAKKLYGLDIEVAPIKPRAKKKIQEACLMAKQEIKEWRKFLRECEKKLK